MFDKGKLDPWLRRQMWGRKTTGTLVSFQLLHAGPSGSSLLEEVTLPEEKIEDADGFIENVIDLMRQASIAACESNGGAQTFAIAANYGEDCDPVYFKFRHSISAFENDNIGGSEPATAQGLLAQTQRHLEGRERSTWGMVGQVMSYQQKMIEKYQEGFDRMLDMQMQMVKASEDLLSKKHERDMSTRAQERKDRTVSEITDKLMALLPIAVYKLTGKNIMGADTTASTAMSDAFIESVGEEQFERLVQDGNLPMADHQRILFMTLLEDYQKRAAGKTKRIEGKSGGNKLPPKPEGKTDL